MIKFIIPLLAGLIMTTSATAAGTQTKADCTPELRQAIVGDVSNHCDFSKTTTIVSCEIIFEEFVYCNETCDPDTSVQVTYSCGNPEEVQKKVQMKAHPM